VGALALIALVLDLEMATSLINIGAFTAFSFVNICVIVLFIKSDQRKSIGAVSNHIVGPLIGLLFIIYLWISLDVRSLIVGLIWTLLGVLYLLFSTNFFKEEPPEINFDELEG